MAKQMYVDENGNPIEVSGTINNASMLPISANDSTDTKTYIDNIADYSTREKAVGKWIDGKTIYKKTIDCGNLPNNASKNVNHNISNIDRIITFEAMATGTNSFLPVPFIGANNYVAINFSNVDIYLATNVDRSGYYLYVTMYYTKSA